VRIELKDPRCRLLYDDQVRSDYIAAYLDKRNAEDPVVKLDRVSLDGRRLHLEIFSFKMLGRKAGKGGHLRVSILILDAWNRRLYEKSRLLAAKESRVSLTVDFAFLKPGKHYFLVEASDLLTGRTVADMLPAEVTAEAP
jgi:hypothetical protein